MSRVRYVVDVRRARVEIVTVSVDAIDAADARMLVDDLIARGELPDGPDWREESVGVPMAGSPRREEP